MPVKYCQTCDSIYKSDLITCKDDNTPLIVDEVLEDTEIGSHSISKKKGGEKRYHITQKIGVGGMGSVYRAHDKVLNRDCAIKVTNKALSSNDEVLKRFYREAKILALLTGDNIVRAYDFGVENYVYFIVMEYVTGDTLYKSLQQKKLFQISDTISIIAGVTKALTEAHGKNVIHRDLKPANIIISKDVFGNYKVKVLDFGIAKLISTQNPIENDGGISTTLTKPDIILGTPKYVSPEQILGTELDARSDIYSFAIIVYEMLAGQLPFPGNNKHEIMMKRLIKDPIPIRTINPTIPVELEQVIMKALSRDLENRIKTAEEFFNLAITAVNDISILKPNASPYQTNNISLNKLPTKLSLKNTEVVVWRQINWLETSKEDD